MELLLERRVPLTAVIADGEELAGACAALETAGLNIPRDVSVVAIGPSGWGREEKAFTKVDVNFVQVGRALASMAIGKGRIPRHSVPSVVVPTQLIKLGSCRPLLDLTSG